MENDHPDPEKALLKALAEVNKFKTEFKKEAHSLKTQFGKLTNSVESLELMGFQEQLNRLHRQIAKINESLLETQRSLASFNVIASFNTALDDVWAKRREKYELFSNEFGMKATEAVTKIGMSDSPLPISEKFREQLYDALDNIGLHIFRMVY
jgi:hypothetical protein